MIERTQERFGLWPERLAADTAYGSAENLAWLVHERGIEPHIPVFDKSTAPTAPSPAPTSPTTTSADVYICPGGKELRQYWQKAVPAKAQPPMRTASCAIAPARPTATPARSSRTAVPTTPGRKILRSIHEGARDMARDIAATDAYLTSRRERKKVEMLFAHLKRILKLDRLRLRGPNGAKDEFLLAATAQNLRKMAKLIPAGDAGDGELRLPSLARPRRTRTSASVKSGLLQHNRRKADIPFSRKAVGPRSQRPGGPTGRRMPPAILPSASSAADIITSPLANTRL